MVNVSPLIVSVAINSMTMSNLARARSQRLSERMSADPTPAKAKKAEKKAKPKEIPEILKNKFEEAWKRQEDRLSGLETKLTDTWHYDTIREYGWTTGQTTYSYSSGKPAKIVSWDDPERTVKCFDESGNCVSRSEVSRDHEEKTTRYVYYPNSDRVEFVDDGISVLHYDTNGKEDTKQYYAKHKIATKRIQYEEETGTTLGKMSKLEEAVAYALKDTKKMTLVEKALADKVKKTQEK